MELRRPAVLISALGAAGIVNCGVARADVSWEHSLTVRISTAKKPVTQVKIFNNWSGGSHRLLIKAPSNSLSSMPSNMPDYMYLSPMDESLALAPKAKGAAAKKGSGISSLAVISQLDNDRIVAYSSDEKQFIKEPLRPLLKRLRFNPWPTLDKKLDKEPVPELTLEQRRRLGAEVRAATKPLFKNSVRSYFRVIPKTRMINGIEGHGYRLTWMVNSAPMTPKSGEWGRVSCEWWLGAELSGDEQIRDYRTKALNLKKEIGGMSASMWLNEFYPVLWQMLPEEIHQAADTIIPPDGSPRAGFGGTPLEMFLTIQPPAFQRSMEGDTRFDLVLRRRHTDTIPASAFEAPSNYKREMLEPELKKYDDLMKGKIAQGEQQAARMGFNLDEMRQASTRAGLLSLMAIAGAK